MTPHTWSFDERPTDIVLIRSILVRLRRKMDQRVWGRWNLNSLVMMRSYSMWSTLHPIFCKKFRITKNHSIFTILSPTLRNNFLNIHPKFVHFSMQLALLQYGPAKIHNFSILWIFVSNKVMSSRNLPGRETSLIRGNWSWNYSNEHNSNYTGYWIASASV